MAITLYEAAASYRALVAELSELDLDPQAVSDTLEGELLPVEERIRAVAVVIANMDAEADIVKTHAKRLAEKAKSIENRIEWLRGYLLANMTACGITEIKAGDVLTVKVKNKPAEVEVFDEKQVPVLYMNQPAPPPAVPDKRMIAEVLKAGGQVPGCRLTQGQRVEIK